MRQFPENIPGARFETRNSRHLWKVADEVGQAKSAQSISALAARICASVLPCDGGGIGVFDQIGNRITLWIPVASHGELPAASDEGLYDQCPLKLELINHWMESGQCLFIENVEQMQYRNGQHAGGELTTGNLVLDGVCKEDGSKVCFYCLANTDKSELPKYQLIMKLLLSSVSSALLQLAAQIDMPEKNNGSLTEREREIIIQIRNGSNNKTIARRLNISLNTVKCHVYNIFQKLNASNRVEALVKARQAGYLA